MLNRSTKVTIAFTVLVALILPCRPAAAQLIPGYWRLLPVVYNSKPLKPLRDRLKQQVDRSRRNGKISLPRLKNLQGDRTGHSPARSGK